MQQASRIVTSNQSGPHRDLARRLERALAHPLKKPVAAHNQRAFDAAGTWYAARRAPLILDAGCGVGLSTRRLAARFPDHAVIGVDRSESRLTREHGALPDNALLVRADLVDFWRLAQAAKWAPVRHYVLYPNPYPKASHLKMRWHGHPVFPALLALGGRLEVRSNWPLYIEEFAECVRLAARCPVRVEPVTPEGEYLTPFEAKYDQSGQPLWRLVCELPTPCEAAS
ncbi:MULTISPECIES: tRNA (guanosine(46)-N(7))-methyltransferase TrmB [unclassified Halomonas]|uniref:tRNA (guanine(46)-N(7))-methyltransferase TrmB n=1 Tax=unclassified Halomonas TaxID=2609666 RepID=UPI0020A05B1E|nr:MULTISPECIES: methyltransferase domain-containing protein [unclassified Halomonas]MCP1313633.1 methyltransferase domain-containing protein [Halomonas sp. 707D7]MCP1325818.1 methyltransferase domain-containing protein [Halomonas sp. 707D4]